jgi:hypothetical protein
MAIARIMNFRTCAMPARALYATRSAAKRTVNPAILRNSPQVLCRCSNPRPSRIPRKAWASTPSNFIGTTATISASTPGNFCVTGVRARSAKPSEGQQKRGDQADRRHELRQKNNGSDFSEPKIWANSTLRQFQYRSSANYVKVTFVGKLSLPSLPTEPAPRSERGPDGI